jgi:hypothetical protein
LPVNEEKKSQLTILNELLGTSLLPSERPVKNKKAASSDTASSVILKRYDPDADAVDDDSNSYAEDKTTAVGVRGELSKPSEITEDEPIRSSEPATYKTVANLKSLFSSEEPSSAPIPSTFSLLATFGQNDTDAVLQNGSKKTTITSKIKKTANGDAPRQFWENNPFKYDSSDDEDEDKRGGGKSKKATKTLSIPLVKSDGGFFFKKKDKRFEGLEAYFLQPDETDERFDYDEKRKELRSIVKAKARNAKRKDEKRTIAIKRAIRKKKKYQKTMIKKSSGNFVKLGNNS